MQNATPNLAQICTTLPNNLTIGNRLYKNNSLVPYTCYGETPEFWYGLEPATRRNFVNKKSKKKPLEPKINEELDFAYWRTLAHQNLMPYYNHPDYIPTRVEFLQIFRSVYSMSLQKKAGLYCGEIRSLTIARIIAHHLNDLSQIPDFLYINYNFNTNIPVDPDDLTIIPDHVTLLLLKPNTLHMAGNELSNSKSNVDAEISDVIKQLLDPTKAGQAFQCDAWLATAGVITTQNIGHCTNALFIKHPEKVERLQLISVHNNPLIEPLIRTFFKMYPHIEKWLMELGQLVKEFRPE